MSATLSTSFIEFKERTARPRFLAERFPVLLAGSLLDVGCDRAVLRPLARGPYVGIDFSPEADLRQDLMKEPRLPFPDRHFDAVVCSDVLEHLENLHAIFDELVRVTRGHLLVTLPNNWNSARLRLARGRGAIAHYGLPLEPPPDRHRWFFGFSEAEEFFRGQARRTGLELGELCALEKPRPLAVRLVRRALAGDAERYRNKYTHTLACLYHRPVAGR